MQGNADGLGKPSRLKPYGMGVEFNLTIAVHGLENAGLRHTRVIAAYLRDQPVFLAVTRFGGGPLALQQLLRIDAIHLPSVAAERKLMSAAPVLLFSPA